MSDSVSNSWFCVLNNPAEHGYEGSPQQVCEKLRSEWLIEDSRAGAWAYCVSAEGLHHVHFVLEDDKAMRFSAIKKSYACGCHLEPTKGSKKDCDDYINKRGKFAEKGEQVEFICYSEKSIKGCQGKRSDLVRFSDMVQQGLTFNEICQLDPTAYKYKSFIRDMYFDWKNAQTPFVRPVSVYWHTGASGSGKSYSRVALADSVGEDNIYYLTDFSSGAFDNYQGQQVLWIEDFHGEFTFSFLLRLLDVYKADIHARYSNVLALWSEVHITSVLRPQECYPDKTSNSADSINQLLRRITQIIYHFSYNGGFYSLPFSPYETENTMFKGMIQRKKEIDVWNNINIEDFEEIL